MLPLIESHLDRLRELCKRHHVQTLDLFGSAASQAFDPESSDLDFLVEFEDLDPKTYSDAYFGLLEALEALFHRHIDLVTSSAITNPYFLESVEKTRTKLYAA